MINRQRPRRALTLLELLVALVILSSVSAFAASVLSDGSRVMRDANLREQAHDVLRRWIVDQDELKPDENGWASMEGGGESWSIRVIEEDAPPVANDISESTKPDPSLHVGWRRLEVWRRDGSTQSRVISVNVLRPKETDKIGGTSQ